MTKAYFEKVNFTFSLGFELYCITNTARVLRIFWLRDPRNFRLPYYLGNFLVKMPNISLIGWIHYQFFSQSIWQRCGIRRIGFGCFSRSTSSQCDLFRQIARYLAILRIVLDQYSERVGSVYKFKNWRK